MYITKRKKMFNTTVYYNIYLVPGKMLTVRDKNIYSVYKIFEKELDFRLNHYDFYITKVNEKPYGMLIREVIRTHENNKSAWF